MKPQAPMRLRTIWIRGLRLDAALGVHAHERGRRQPVEIDVEIDVDDRDPQDDVARVLDYETVVDSIRTLLSGDHVDLVETLADRVAALALEHPTARRARVRILKLKAINACDGVGVSVERSKDQF